MRNRFAQTFYELGQQDPRLCLVVADISPASSIEDFRREFPDRFINVGVAEQVMIGMTAGMVRRGLRPFAYTIAPFTLFRPFEFIRDDICYPNLPVTMVGMGAGLCYPTLGATHHAQEDIGVASAVPNLMVLAPCDPEELDAATRWCAQQEQGPVYLRIGKTGEPTLTADALTPFEFGKLRYLCRGEDTLILGYGPILREAFALKERMEAAGESVSIISAHTVKPFDGAGAVEAIRAHKRVVIIEETAPGGSLGPKVKALAYDAGLRTPITAFSLLDAFSHTYGSVQDLLGEHGLTAAAMAVTLGLPDAPQAMI